MRANIKLAISGGQNEPRDAIAGAAWRHSWRIRSNWRVLRSEVPGGVFDEYAPGCRPSA